MKYKKVKLLKRKDKTEILVDVFLSPPTSRSRSGWYQFNQNVRLLGQDMKWVTATFYTIKEIPLEKLHAVLISEGFDQEIIKQIEEK